MPLLQYSQLALTQDLFDTCLAELMAINGPWMDRARRIDELPIIILTPDSNGKATTNAPFPSIGRACPFRHCCFKYVSWMGFLSSHFFSGMEVINLLWRTKPYPVCICLSSARFQQSSTEFSHICSTASLSHLRTRTESSTSWSNQRSCRSVPGASSHRQLSGSWHYGGQNISKTGSGQGYGVAAPAFVALCFVLIWPP